ncbi:RNA polymerase III transcription factor IIIC subunit-domain-containing protein [Gymnopilus junonius]|uniref:RNA polymerase III transcription factor IIIC subunit-domain-containing protein n=1 Tax=Gymnopilus junonius TaxID=109634 RepID=A0A9P5TMT6_GYMJU|nr:RNA polymerase III transcription factor IIIC subunit-domain-containing protein [Gymnopilus junonius]
MDSDPSSEPPSSQPQFGRPLPQVSFYSIEYPGYVTPSSVPIAVRNVGGQAKIDRAFKRTAQKSDALLELSLHPESPFAHPIPGDVIGANNLLLKVVKRKRKRPADSSDAPPIGEYTAEVVGVMSRTARFRSMIDYQYFPNPDDSISKLRMAMNNMDVDSLSSYTIPAESSKASQSPRTSPENDIDMNLDPQLLSASQLAKARASIHPESALRLFPPPLFSRQTIPQGYNFKANTASMETTVVDEETGQERKRMINRMRWKGYGPACIMFSDNHVPDRPPQAVEQGRSEVNENILKKIEALFQERPVWTRMSLFNQFSAGEARDILNSKLLLPLCCYVFQDGPWRDTLVRFSYDPRKDPSSRFFQRLYFRNANHPISRPSVTTRRHDRVSSIDHLRGLEKETERRNSHVFDGQTLTKETAAFQLCDITDPMLKEMIEDPDALREACDERDGWYTSHAFEQIKTVLRHKFFSLLEGYPPTDDECRALLVSSEGSLKTSITQRSTKLRAGKHNMAKGALRPEDAAAMRLRATLDRSMKSFQSQR